MDKIAERLLDQQKRKARRRFVLAAILTLLACLLLPFVLREAPILSDTPVHIRFMEGQQQVLGRLKPALEEPEVLSANPALMEAPSSQTQPALFDDLGKNADLLAPAVKKEGDTKEIELIDQEAVTMDSTAPTSEEMNAKSVPGSVRILHPRAELVEPDRVTKR